MKIQIEVNCMTSAKIDNIRIKMKRMNNNIPVGTTTKKIPKDVLGVRDYWPEGRFPMRESRWEGYIDFEVPVAVAKLPNTSFRIGVLAKMETGHKNPKVDLPITID